MKVQKIIMKNLDSWVDFLKSDIQKDTIAIQITRKWNKDNVFRIYHYENVKAVVRRGKNSSVLPEIPVGNLVTNGYIYNDVYIWDDPFWSYQFGKSCVFNNDAKPYQLFISGTRERIHPTNTEKMLITQLAMKRVFENLDIPVEFFSDADVYLLPSRDKFACGFSRAMKQEDGSYVRYEGGWVSYYIDHDLFQQILPPKEYNRDNSHDPNHAGIDGIENKYPDFDRDSFINDWIVEIANIVEENPVVEVLEDIIF